MTNGENSVTKNDSDEDIYQELNLGEELYKIKAENDYQKNLDNLNEKLKILNEENEKLRNLNTILEKNLSILLKTAQAEVKRKDSTIDDLRTKLDSIAFKRKSKMTKDQSTCTEEKEFGINFYSESVACKNDKGFKEHRLLNNKNSKNKQDDINKIDERKLKQRNSSSNNNKKENYSCKNSKSSGYAHTEEKSDMFDEKCKEFSYSLRERNESSHLSYRKNQKSDSKLFSEKNRHSRTRDNYRYSLYDRSPKKKSSKDKESERQYRKSSKRTRSRSPRREHIKKSKESSFDNQKCSSKKYSKSKKRERTKSKERELRKKSKSISPIIQKLNDKNRTQESDTKLEEANLGISRLHLKNSSMKESLCDTKTKKISKLHELEEGEYVENSEFFSENEEIEKSKLPFKNERQSSFKPLTLYSKRMMEKFSEKPVIDKISSKNLKETSISVVDEKEPGELTDDENIIENSDEFKNITKAAVLESNIVNETSFSRKESSSKKNFISSAGEISALETREKETNFKKSNEVCHNSNFNNFQVPLPVENKLLFDKPKENSKKICDSIEFSPFKNNYKLIEISPSQIQKKKHSMNNCTRNFHSSSSQKTMEKSIFNLLSKLSGVPIDSCEKKSSEEPSKTKNSQKEIVANSSINLPVEKTYDLEPTKCAETNSSLEVQKGFITENISAVNNFKKKSISIKHYLSKSKEKNEEQKSLLLESKKEEVIADENSPGETTQFLNFFLLTTSPSTPILPAEEEKLLKNAPQSQNTSPSNNKFEFDNISPVGISNIKESENTNISSKNISTKICSLKDIDFNNHLDCEMSKFDSKPEEFKKENETSKETKAIKNKETQQKRKENDISTNGSTKGEKEEKSRKKRKISDDDNFENVAECKNLKIISKKNLKKQELKNDQILMSEDCEKVSEVETKIKEDISFFEFFKPIVKKDEKPESSEVEDFSNADFKMTATMSVTGVVRLETPNKCIKKLKNLMINEQTIYQVLDSNKNSSFSPLIGTKMVEMTPQRMLRNDLMLTDSEDDSVIKNNNLTHDGEKEKGKVEDLEKKENGDWQEEDSKKDFEEFFNRETDSESDSGASDFVDQL